VHLKAIKYQQLISKINNLYFFINKINFDKKSKVFNFALLMFVAFFIICQSLAISHLSSHSYQNNYKKNQNFSANEISSLDEEIVQINKDDFINCNLCFFANFQKKINNSALIFIAIILVNLIFEIKLKLFNFPSKTSSSPSRAPPFFA